MSWGAVITGITVVLLTLPVHAGSVNDSPLYVDLKGEHLRYGKSVWLLNCETCHAYGVADAPIPMNPSEWQFRLEKGRDVLYDHAINGYFGPDDSMMPPRGGNENLTDREVSAAVDYMAELAAYYIQQQEEMKDDK